MSTLSDISQTLHHKNNCGKTADRSLLNLKFELAQFLVFTLFNLIATYIYPFFKSKKFKMIRTKRINYSFLVFFGGSEIGRMRAVRDRGEGEGGWRHKIKNHKVLINFDDFDDFLKKLIKVLWNPSS